MKSKKDFPVLANNPGLVYLDSTATSLKPKSVIDKITEYYSQYSANIFRGVYKISERATLEYEETRKTVARFINSKSASEIIFTRNTTESINLIAYALGREIVSKDDEIVTTIMEHHSNFVPWQILANEVGAAFKVVDIDENGLLNLGPSLEALKNIITKKTKIVSLTYVSNVLGTINPVAQIIREVKKINPEAIVILDAAQAAPHMKIDVSSLGCDFLVFSAHKMLGPTGVGILWGKYKVLEKMYPFIYGGEMISQVHIDRTTFKDPPHKFEAGTPAIGEVVAFKEAIKYLENIGMDKVRDHEKSLTTQFIKRLKEEFPKEIKILGPETVENRGGVVAFNFNSFHPHDVAAILDESNIAIRAGHHCAMPLHERLNIGSSARASFYIYNDETDIEKMILGLKKVKKILNR